MYLIAASTSTNTSTQGVRVPVPDRYEVLLFGDEK